MKRILVTALACVAMLSACVEKEGPIETPVDNSEKYACTLPESYVNGKEAWVPGDQIIIHGEYSKDQATVTLTAEDISLFAKKN